MIKKGDGVSRLLELAGEEFSVKNYFELAYLGASPDLDDPEVAELFEECLESLHPEPEPEVTHEVGMIVRPQDIEAARRRNQARRR
jgi:hypothetical protein